MHTATIFKGDEAIISTRHQAVNRKSRSRLLASDFSMWVLWWTNLQWVKISPSTPTCTSQYYSTSVLDPLIYLPSTRDIALENGSGVK
jgi:hypothetical protein